MKLEGTATIKTGDGRIDLTFAEDGVTLDLWCRVAAFDETTDEYQEGERVAGGLELTWEQFDQLAKEGSAFRAAASSIKAAA